MKETTEISIDIEVYRAIEALRTSFNQSANDILRRILSLEADTSRVKAKSTREARNFESRKVYEIELLSDKISGRFLIEVYRKCLLRLADLDPQFLEGFSAGASRQRRFVARDPKRLYLKSPRLAKDYAQPLCGTWFYDTNLSEPQIKQRLKYACKVAGLEFGVDLIYNL